MFRKINALSLNTEMSVSFFSGKQKKGSLLKLVICNPVGRISVTKHLKYFIFKKVRSETEKFARENMATRRKLNSLHGVFELKFDFTINFSNKINE